MGDDLRNCKINVGEVDLFQTDNICYSGSRLWTDAISKP